MGTRTTTVWGFPQERPWLSLGIAIVVCEVVGASGAIFTSVGLETWYPSLAKPTIAPPNWVFAPVWTTLFALMGIAVWLVWKRAEGRQGDTARIAIGVFAIHFVVNIGWSAAFFGFQSILIGLVVIAGLWFAILLTIILFDRVDRRAAVLLVPYLLWVTFAGYLNYAFWTLN